MSDFYSPSLCLQIGPAWGISDQREINFKNTALLPIKYKVHLIYFLKPI
jgi:hypothetical protein